LALAADFEFAHLHVTCLACALITIGYIFCDLHNASGKPRSARIRVKHASNCSLACYQAQKQLCRVKNSAACRHHKKAAHATTTTNNNNNNFNS
jgi:hypothetical protein